MANQIIPQKDFDNIVSLFRSKQLDNIQLGMCLVRGQKCYKQFRDHFGKSFKEFQYFFRNIVPVALQIQNRRSDWIINELILHIVNNVSLPQVIISDIIILKPQLYKDFNLDRLSGLYISCILRRHPHLYTEFDLSKCIKSDIDWICQFQPQLKPYFNQA